MATTDKKVVIPDDMGKTIEFKNKKWNVKHDDSIKEKADGTLYVEAVGGLDCAAIDALPQKTWKKGTTVLAKQDNECVRLVAPGDLFTDIVLSLTTAKNSVQVVTGNSEVVNLVATVTNAGTNPSSEVRLILTKPSLGTYSLGTPQLESRNATEFVKVSETEYTIKSLASGGVATVTIPVTYSKQGTFSFGAQVTSTLDTNTTNNSKTVTVSVTERVTETGGNYVPTQDCPLFTITDLEYNQKLRTFGRADNPNVYHEVFMNGGINIYGDKKSIAGRRWKLENVEQVVLMSSANDTDVGMYTSFYSSSWSSSSTRVIQKPGYQSHIGFSNTEKEILGSSTSSSFYGNTSGYGSSFTSAAFSKKADLYVSRDFYLINNYYTPTGMYYKRNEKVISTDYYSFDKTTGILMMGSSLTSYLNKPVTDTNIGSLVMYVKPKGENCNWQICVIKFTNPLVAYTEPKTSKIITNTDLANVEFEYVANSIRPLIKSENDVPPYEDHANYFYDAKATWIGSSKPSDLKFVAGNSLDKYIGLNDTYIYQSNYLVFVRIKRGTSGTFTLTATDDRLAKVQTRGEIETSYDASNKTLTVTLKNPQPQNSIDFNYVKFHVID